MTAAHRPAHLLAPCLSHTKAVRINSAALTVLLAVEAYVRGLIRDDSKDALTAVHVPSAMAIMGLVIWIPVHTRRIGTRP